MQYSQIISLKKLANLLKKREKNYLGSMLEINSGICK